MPTWHYTGDIVVTGASAKMPESENIAEFKENLYNHVDMITDAETRWPAGLYGLPKRLGKLKELSKFDASFFGINPKQAHVMDPQLRIMLELVYEAIIDAGYNPLELRNSNTGVFIGVSGSETQEAFGADPETLQGGPL